MEKKNKDILDVHAVNKHSDEYHVGYLEGYASGVEKGEQVGYERGIKMARQKVLSELKMTFPQLKVR